MKLRNGIKVTLLFLLFMIYSSCDLFAHTINYSMEIKPTENVILYYIFLGFQHILPLGFDHILFILGLYLMDSKMKNVLLLASCFTLAHTITLILSSKGIIMPPVEIIEPIIALSIVFIAVENIVSSGIKPFRYIIVFIFGLVHGMGFASALNETGLPRNNFYTSLISFNVGVELGQIAVILIAYFCIGLWFKEKIWYKQRVVIPLSLCISIIAFYWVIERSFL